MLFDFASSLYWHLTSNHYPPFPSGLAESLTDAAAEAVAAVEFEDYDAEIKLPDGLLVNGKGTITASQMVEWLHLDDYVGFEFEGNEPRGG